MKPSSPKILLSFFFFNVYFEKKKKSMNRGGAEMERKNPKQAPHVSTEPDTGLDLMNCETVGCLTD